MARIIYKAGKSNRWNERGSGVIGTRKPKNDVWPEPREYTQTKNTELIAKLLSESALFSRLSFVQALALGST